MSGPRTQETAHGKMLVNAYANQIKVLLSIVEHRCPSGHSRRLLVIEKYYVYILLGLF